MIIVNQDKTEIINFDNTLNIIIYPKYDDSDNEIGYEIYAGMKAPDDNNIKLGCYKTEEKAKEVLQDIVTLYEFSNLGDYMSIQNDGIKFGNEISRVFYMPEE